MYRTILPSSALAQIGFTLLALGGLSQFAVAYQAAEKLAEGVALDVSYTQAGFLGGLLVRAGLLLLAWTLTFDEVGRERSVAERCVGIAAAAALVIAFAMLG